MHVAWVSTYRPAWHDGSRRVLGPDEDMVTLAVAAGRSGLDEGDGHADVSRVTVVMQEPDVLNSAAAGVVRRGLGIKSAVPVDFRVGGGTDALEAVLSAGVGTLVIGVENGVAGAAAGAAMIGGNGAVLHQIGLVDASLPMRVRHLGDPATSTYDDPRLERERGWRPSIAGLTSPDTTVFLAGVPSKEVGKFGAEALGADEALAAAAPFFILAAMASAGRDGRLVALDSALAVAAEVREARSAEVLSLTREPVPVQHRPCESTDGIEIPISMPAYERAFESKVGLLAARCECGELSFPPRRLCLGCGVMDATVLQALPRTAEVYSVVTIHIRVPGMASPYALAIVSLDDVPIRVLAPVADVNPLDCAIGDRGVLVLRRMATREGVPDYGFAFQPTERKGSAA